MTLASAEYVRYEWCVRLHKAGKEGSGLTGDVLDVWEKGREEGLDGREPGQEVEAKVGSWGPAQWACLGRI